MTATWTQGQLTEHVPDAHVLTGAELDGYEIDGLQPAAVVRPADVDGIAAILRFATDRGLSVIPWGGGTAMGLGNRPSRLDLIVDLTRLNRILEHRPQDLTVTVEAGVTLDALQTTLAAHGQMLALDPPCGERATVGGVLAANSNGPRRYRYGTARDLLIGSRALLADGTPVRSGGKVVKNVAGYDLNKLWIGSCGSLAVIVEATFKVIPVPSGLGLLVALFTAADAAHAMAMTVAGSRLQPLSLDLIGPPVSHRLTSGVMSDLAAHQWLLVVELGGPQPVVERTKRELMSIAPAAGASQVASLTGDQRERLQQRIRDYGRSTDDPAAWIVRLSVLPTETAQAIEAVRETADGSLPPIIARPGSGVVYCYLLDGDSSIAISMIKRLRERIDGSVIVEQAPDMAKADLDIWGLAGPDWELMRRVKDTYDPAGTLSPGRVV
jgi:glycolate oxidase FAD binding subunit